jgi:methanethiol S-methyltransferase
VVRRVVPPELERSLYTWVASLLFIAVCAWWRPLPGVLYDVPHVWRFVAYAAQAAGIMLTVRASAKLDVLDLAGVRAVQRALHPTATVRHVPLETTGLYGFVRHPLYFAWALFVFATPTMTATRALFAVVSTAYLAAAIPWEERSLMQTFGADYEAYRRKVRWRMVPGVY